MDANNFWIGVVESRDDPLTLGRVQCRIVGLHTEDKSLLPTADLPWAYVMQPITSGAMSGVGAAPVGAVPGTWVIIMFVDPDKQNPIVMGTFAGIPQAPKTAGGAEVKNGNIEQNHSVSYDGTVTKPWDKYSTFEQRKLIEQFGSPAGFELPAELAEEINTSELTVTPPAP